MTVVCLVDDSAKFCDVELTQLILIVHYRSFTDPEELVTVQVPTEVTQEDPDDITFHRGINDKMCPNMGHQSDTENNIYYLCGSTVHPLFFDGP